MPHRMGTALVVLLALACISLEAWAGKVGPEFPINTFRADTQDGPSVARLGNSRFVVTWTSYGQDGSSFGVYGQRYNAVGAVGGQFRVNTKRASSQSSPSVAPLGNGGFVVTWQSHGQDGSFEGVYGQRYTAAGARAGGEFPVNTFTAGYQQDPSVAGLGDDGFVVTWESTGQDGSGDGVYGQRYNAAGARSGGEFPVNTHTPNNQSGASVAGLGNGGFVVTWSSDGHQDGSEYGVYGQLYNATGSPVGGEFKVNTYTASYQLYPAVAALGDGGFVVTWASYVQDGSVYGVYGQRYNAAGAPVGSELPVNTFTAGDQYLPAVAALSNGGFVVTWTSDGQDGAEEGIYGQRYSATGAPVGGEFRVNTRRANRQWYPSVAGFGDGGFVVTWTSYYPQGSFGDDVYGQRFNP